MPRTSINRTVWDHISADRLNGINDDLDNIYENWDDRLKIFPISWLEIQIAPGNFRVGNAEWIFAWDTATLDDDSVSYVQLNGGGVVVISTVWWDENFARLAKVTTASWEVTAIEIRRQDVVGWLLWWSPWFKNITDTVYNTKNQLTSFDADWTTYTITYNINGSINTINKWSIVYTMSYNAQWLLTWAVES
jgi:hypothetical protein